MYVNMGYYYITDTAYILFILRATYEGGMPYVNIMLWMGLVPTAYYSLLQQTTVGLTE